MVNLESQAWLLAWEERDKEVFLLRTLYPDGCFSTGNSLIFLPFQGNVFTSFLLFSYIAIVLGFGYIEFILVVVIILLL